MWNKPKELAGYADIGFEIAAYGTVNDRPSLQYDQTMRMWQQSPPLDNVILNRDIWTRYRLRALGAVCGYGFAAAWIGATPDG